MSPLNGAMTEEIKNNDNRACAWQKAFCESECHYSSMLPFSENQFIKRTNMPQKDVAETRAMPQGCEQVLVVDDEPNLAQLIALILDDAGYRVLAASNADEAVALFDQAQGRVDVLLSDISMPGVTGPELYKSLRERNPELKVLFMSGYAAYNHESLSDVGEENFIQKPFGFKILCERVREVLERETLANSKHSEREKL